MKTYPPRSFFLPVPAFIIVAVLAMATTGCSDSLTKENAKDTQRVAADPVAPAGANPALPPAPVSPANAPAMPVAQWQDVANLGFDDRADCYVGIARLNMRLEQQIAGLKTRRSEITSADDPGKWDAAMEVLSTARTRWISTSTDLTKATPDNWGQLKERVGDAWTNVQSAYEDAEAEAPR